MNVCTADLPGPRVPLYLAGARVLEVFPLLPLVGQVSLGIGALSYAGRFNVTVVADRATHPDLQGRGRKPSRSLGAHAPRLAARVLRCSLTY